MSAIAIPFRPEGFTLDDWSDVREADGDHHYELSDGRLIIMNSAHSGHATVVMRLAIWFVKHGYSPDVLMADMALETGVRDGREPDLMLLYQPVPLMRRITPNLVRLAIEVESESSLRDDRIAKPREYAHAGVAHYWRISGANQPDTATIECSVLRGDHYDRYHSGPLDGFMAAGPVLY